MPSGEYTASSIRKPLRSIMGSKSQVKVECSSRMCSIWVVFKDHPFTPSSSWFEAAVEKGVMHGFPISLGDDP
jgi:hypothetical protein